MRREGGAIVVAIVAIVAFVSCRQLVGIRDDPPTVPAGSPDASPGDASNAVCTADGGACESCLGESCCGELTACSADASCEQSLGCLLGCAAGDESCAAVCVPRMDATLAEVLSCRASSCASACGVSCGGILGALYPDYLAGSPDCAACATGATAQTCGVLTACAASASCIAYAACLDRSCEPFDRACNTQCRYAVGPTPAADTIVTAFKSACPTQCRLGSNFDCVGKRAWPLGVVDTPVTFNAQATDQVSGQAAAGVLVKTCPVADTACSAPWDQETTDDAGYVSVGSRLTAQGNAYAGLFQGYFDVSGATTYPSVAFLFPPLAGSIAGDSTYTPYEVQVVSRDDLAYFAGALPMPLDPTRGHVEVVAFDCLQLPAAGVSATITPSDGALVAYTRNDVYAPQATTTDSTGAVVIVNVEPGPIEISLTLAATGELVSQVNAFVRPQTLTSIGTAPLPP